MMKSRNANGVLVLPLFAALAVGPAACGAGDTARDDAPADVPAVTIENPATIRGHAHFEGAAPQLTLIDMSDEPACAERHTEGPYQEDAVVAGDGSLKNVFVYVREGLGDGPFPAPRDGVVLDQLGCVYRPRVLGIRAGQNLIVRNSDGLLHNVNARPTANRGFNFSQPTNMETTRSFTVHEVMIPVRCDVHGWMNAYIGVIEHPYFAVSAADGSFTIPNLPPGDYVLEAWHERWGTRTINVSVGPDETAEIHVAYSEATAGPVPLAEPIDLHDHGPGGHDHTSAGGM